MTTPSNPVRLVDNDGQISDTNPLPVQIQGIIDTDPNITIWSMEDDVLNDSDKIYTVTAGEEWTIDWIWVKLITTATVGNRQLYLELQRADGTVIAQTRITVTQAASLTRYYFFAVGNDSDSAFVDTDYLRIKLPYYLLKAGQKIRIYDKAAIAAAADDMTVHMQYERRVLP